MQSSLSRWGVLYTLYDLELNEIETCFVEHPSTNMEVLTAAALILILTAEMVCEDACDVITNKAKHIDYEKVVAVCITYPGLYLEKIKCCLTRLCGWYKA